MSPLRGGGTGRGLTLLAFLLSTFLPSPAAADPGYPIDDWLAEVAFTAVRLSPDGTRLAFVTRRDDPVQDVEEHTLWWIDLAEGALIPAPATSGPADFTELRWSPDGTLLSWLSIVEGAQHLHVLEPQEPGGPRWGTDPARFPSGGGHPCG